MATTRLKPIGHDDRLSIVEHLTELRTRIIICVVGFSLAFGLCLWQEDRILDVVNKPLADVANAKPCDETRDPLEQADCWQQSQKVVNERLAAAAAEAGASAVIVLDLARVGMRRGVDVDLLRRIRAAVPKAELVVAGGVRGLSDLAAAAAAGCDAALVATALYDGRILAADIASAGRTG